MNRGLLNLVVIITAMLTVSLIVSLMDVVKPPYTIKSLGLAYIENSYFGKYSSMSPEVVTAIV